MEARSRSPFRAIGVFATGWLIMTALAPLQAASGAPPAGTSDRIQPRLLRLLDEYERNGDTGLRRAAAAQRIQLRESAQGALIPVILELRPGLSTRDLDRQRIEAVGGHVDAVSDSFVRVLVRPSDARSLAELPEVQVVRSPAIAKALGSGFGQIVSDGVTLTGAALLQQSGITGTGVKVAVVDLGFQGLSKVIAAGELPASTVSMDFTNTGIETTTQHGVAVAEELMDMAPGVQLYCLKVGDEVDVQNAATYLRTNSIRIANHSVGWVVESYYDDTGLINGIINSSHDTDGVFWSVAAGNAAKRHWRGTWSDPDKDGRLNFSPTANSMGLAAPDPGSGNMVSVYLNWNQYGNSVTDLNLYVFDKMGATAGSSTNLQTGTQIPEEDVEFQYDPSRAPYRATVVYAGGSVPSTLDITLFSFDNNFAIPIAASSLTDPADAHGATAVGAIPESAYAIAKPSPEPFSSQGPTNDGRLKPDLCAPDGTMTYTYGKVDGLAVFFPDTAQWVFLDPEAGAFGTSFTAPMAAGAAALLLQQTPTLTAPQLASALGGLALPISAKTPNPLCGSGRLLASGTTIPKLSTAMVLGNLSTSFNYGGSGFLPVYGDWDGDGVATVGVFDPSSATWYLRNEAGGGNPDLTFQFGPPGALPVVGDWDGNGTTTVGVFVPGSAQWYLRNSNAPGGPDVSFQYGFPGALPVAGDWTGNHTETPGLYYPPTGLWLLRSTPGGGPPTFDFSFGYAGTQPLAGDWSGSGMDGIGIFAPSTGWNLQFTPSASTGLPDEVVPAVGFKGGLAVSVPTSSPDLPDTPTNVLPPLSGDQVGLFDPQSGTWILQYGNAPTSPFAIFGYGAAGFVPVFGDWDGDGVATLGAFVPSTATWYLRNTPGPGPAELVFQFGPAGSLPVVGDWDGNGTTTVGVFVPGSAHWYLRNSNSSGAPDFSFGYGFAGVMPVAGHWNGGKVDTVGIYYPPTGQWFLRNSPGPGAPGIVFSYGYAGTQPLVGDWNGVGSDGIGIYDPSSGTFLLRNSASAGGPDLTVSIGGGLNAPIGLVWHP